MKLCSQNRFSPLTIHSNSWYLIKPQEPAGSEQEAGRAIFLNPIGHSQPWSVAAANRAHGDVQQRSCLAAAAGRAGLLKKEAGTRPAGGRRYFAREATSG